MAFFQKVRCGFQISKINIPNHYPELEIWISCLLLWAGNSNFKFRIVIWNSYLGNVKNTSHFLKKKPPLKSPIDGSYYNMYRDKSTKLFTWWPNRPNWWYPHLWVGIQIGLLLSKLLLSKYKKPRMSQEFSWFYSMKFDTLLSLAGLVKHGCCTRVINLCYFFSRTPLQLM